MSAEKDEQILIISVDKVRDELERTGFCAVHEKDLWQSAMALCSLWDRCFFSLSQKVKDFHVRPLNSHIGYVSERNAEQAIGSNAPDRKEYYQLYIGQGKNRHPLVSDELWEASETYFKKALDFGTRVLNQVTREFSMEDLLENSMLRIICYPDPPGLNTIVAAPHEDIDLLTVLPSSCQKGLEVVRGKKYIKVPHNRELVILNSGDLLHTMLPFVHSARHRVVRSKGDGTRLSCPLFLHPRGDKILGTLPASEIVRERLNAIERT